MQKSVHISSPHSIVILLEMVGLQMHSLHWVDTGTLIWPFCIWFYFLWDALHTLITSQWLLFECTRTQLNFEVSWPCLDGLCGSVIWAQSRHPESIHLTSKQFCNFTGCSHPSSRASPFGLDRYMIDLLLPEVFFPWKVLHILIFLQCFLLNLLLLTAQCGLRF